jgi:ParB-like chromosome segregation protein Spo0J
LAAELKDAGQINDAHAAEAVDGTLELLSGSRRRLACIEAGMELRVRVHGNLSPGKAIAIAFRGDRGAVEISYWDQSVTWARLLADKAAATDTALAKLCGVHPATVSRGLALQRADPALLAAFGKLSDITMNQWTELAPLVDNDEVRPRILERASLLAGKGFTAPRVVTALKAAAANKAEIKAIDVRNRHDKVIATIKPDHRGGFTVSVKPMREDHPSYRLERAKIVHDALVATIKTWFDDVA